MTSPQVKTPISIMVLKNCWKMLEDSINNVWRNAPQRPKAVTAMQQQRKTSTSCFLSSGIHFTGSGVASS